MKSFIKYFLIVVSTIVITITILLTGISSYLGVNRTQLLDLGRIVFTYRLILHNYVDATDSTKLSNGAIEGMLSTLNDPHSNYLDPKLYQQLMEQTEGSFAGIGVVVGENKDKITTVIGVIDGTPGDKAGLKPGDQIIKVNGEPAKGLSLDKVTAKIRGPVGTKVTLTILHQGKTHDVEITRANIELKSVSSKLLPDDMGYIRISSFGEHTATEFHDALTKLDQQHIKGLIIDLRNNPGGLLSSVVDIAKSVVPEGPIVSIVNKQGEKEVYSSSLKQQPYPIVVLVNENSASAAEILTGALKDTKAATIVGVKTYGKGSVQTLWPLFHKDALKLTIAKYYTPSGVSIDKIGITPDVVIPSNTHNNIDNQLNKAIEILQQKIKKS